MKEIEGEGAWLSNFVWSKRANTLVDYVEQDYSNGRRYNYQMTAKD